MDIKFKSQILTGMLYSNPVSYEKETDNKDNNNDMYIIVEGDGNSEEQIVKDSNADENPIENADGLYTGVIDYETKRRLKNEAKAQVKKKFIIGRTYYLKGRGNIKKEFILKKFIYTINEAIVNIVIMKQITGPRASIYTLNPYDCKRYHIKYEDGLQVFSMQMNWILKRATTKKINGNTKKTGQSKSSTKK